jgi:hypothetical protein
MNPQRQPGAPFGARVNLFSHERTKGKTVERPEAFYMLSMLLRKISYLHISVVRRWRRDETDIGEQRRRITK